jgi:hypothetical protein
MVFMFYADKLPILEALKRSQNGFWFASATGLHP